ncbi:MAG: winged helix-turn-helix domain-containing protein [Nanoarchaeota archaeon]
MITPQRLRHLMWYTFAGTKGGLNRIKIIELLRQRPFNSHQLSKELGLDYRTIIHHIKILVDNEFIACDSKKYGEVYFLTDIFQSEISTFEEILKKM